MEHVLQRAFRRYCHPYWANEPMSDANELSAALARNDWPVVEAITARLLSRRPADAELWLQRGVALKNLQRFAEAELAFRRGMLLAPEAETLRINLAAVWVRQGRMLEAERESRRSFLRSKSEWAGVNLAAALIGQDRCAEAIEVLLPLVDLCPTMSELWGNLGVAQRRLRDPAATISLRRCFAIQNDDTTAFNLALELLQSGELPEGFALMERRWGSQSFRELNQAMPASSIPVWHGESLVGKSLWLVAEQGLGDTLQFIRYVSHVLKTGVHKLVVLCPEALVSLLAESFSAMTVEVVDNRHPPQKPPDFMLPLMSAPHRFGTTLDSIPWSGPYLKVPENARVRIGERITRLPGPRIGLCWAGGTALKLDVVRSMPPSLMAALTVNFPHVSWVSLQKHDGKGYPGECVPQCIDLMPEVVDFADTAAIIEALDLVISVDTSVAHLTGALGKPVWLLNRYAGEWRWLSGRSDSPWYPTMRIFTQPAPRDWDSLVCELVHALEREFALSTWAALANQLWLYYVDQSVTLQLPHKRRTLAAPTAEELANQQIPSNRLYLAPTVWEIEHIRRHLPTMNATVLPLHRLPMTVLPPRLLSFGRRGDVVAQIDFFRSKRGRGKSDQPLRLALMNGFGTMLGDTLIGSSAFAKVAEYLKSAFGAVHITAFAAWNARPGVEQILARASGIDAVLGHAPTVEAFCQFDAFWDFSALLYLPGYSDRPLYDFYLDCLGVDPGRLSDQTKKVRFVVNRVLRAQATEQLAQTAKRPFLLVHPTASTPLRSMPDAFLARLLRALIADGKWQPVVVQALSPDLANEFGAAVLDLSAWSNLSVEHFFALMGCMKAVVSVDTLTIHVATGLEKPGVALFSSIDPELRLRYAPKIRGVLIPGARNLPLWGDHKHDGRWDEYRSVYESAWAHINTEEVLEFMNTWL